MEDLASQLKSVSHSPDLLQNGDRILDNWLRLPEYGAYLSEILLSTHEERSLLISVHLHFVFLLNFAPRGNIAEELHQALLKEGKWDSFCCEVGDQTESDTGSFAWELAHISLIRVLAVDYPDKWPDFAKSIVTHFQDMKLLFRVFIGIFSQNHDDYSIIYDQMLPHITQGLSSPDDETVETSLELLYYAIDGLSWTDGTEEKHLRTLETHWEEIFEILKITLSQMTRNKSLFAVLKILTIFFRDYIQFSRPYFARIMGDVWIFINRFLPSYLAFDVIFEHPEPSFEFEGETLRANQAIGSQIMELIGCLVLRPSVAEAMQAEIPAFINILVWYSLITKEQETLWHDDVNQYITEDEVEDNIKSIRQSVSKMISDLVEMLRENAVLGIIFVINRLIERSTGLESVNDWLITESPELQPVVQEVNQLISQIYAKRPLVMRQKLREACMSVLGHFSSDIIVHVNKSKNSDQELDLHNIFDSSQYEFSKMQWKYFIGRFYWAWGRLSEATSAKMCRQMLQLSLMSLSQTQDLAVHLAICYCINKMSRHLNEADSSMVPIVDQLLQKICQIASVTTQDTLPLVLETLLDVSSLSTEASAKVPSYASNIFLQLYTSYFMESSLNKQIIAALRYWCDIPECIPYLVQAFAPYILKLLTSHPRIPVKSGSQASASTIDSRANSSSSLLLPSSFDILSIFLRKTHSDTASRKQVISLLPHILEILRTTEDVSILQSGTSCLRTYVAFASPQITEEGLIDQVIETTTFLLDPTKNELGAIHLGYLIIQIFDKLSPQVDEDLLIGCLNKIYRSKMPSSIQGLVLVFARLIHAHAYEVLNFLSNQSIDRRVALKMLLDKWLIHQPLIRGRYTKNATITALSRMYTLKDPKLETMLVVGYNPSHSNVGSEVIAPFKILSTLIRCLDNESHVPKRRLNDELGLNEEFETVVDGSGLGIAGEYDSGARVDTIEEDDYQSEEEVDSMSSLKKNLLNEIKEDYELQEFNIPESKDRGLADYEIGSECLMSDMLDFDYEDNDDLGEDFFEDDMHGLGDWYGGISLQSFLLDFFKNLMDNDRDYLKSCMRHLGPEDLALMNKHFDIQ